MKMILWFMIVSVMFQTTGAIICNTKACIECMTSLFCTKCIAGHFLKTFSRSIHYCAECPQHCVDCYDQNACTACKDDTTNCGAGCTANCTNCVTNHTVCTRCQTGQYGPGCQFACSLGCSQGCDKDTGNCHTCKAGYYGNNCTLCSSTCKDGICDKVNGHCLACQDTYYGQNCTGQCLSTCKDGICDPSNGTCAEGCKTGYWTAQCDKSCSENCNNCHQGNGQCLECASKNMYGDWCNISCTTRCQRNECNQQTGMCLGGCMGNYYGQYCSHVCPETCKTNTTSLVAVCHQQNGSCAECGIGHFGELCTSECDENCVDNECSKDTGYCVHGCNQGYQQRNGSCVNKASAVSDARPTVALIGGTVGGVVMLAAVLTSVMVVVRIKLRNTRMAEDEDTVDMQNVIMDQVGQDAHPTGLSDTAPRDQGSIRPDRATLEGPSGCCAVEIDTNVMYLPMDGASEREFFTQSLQGDGGEKERDLSFSQSVPGPEDGEAKERYSKLAIGRGSGLEAGARPCGQNHTSRLPMKHSDDGYIGPDPEVDNYVNTESVDDELNSGHVIGKLEAAVRSCGQNPTNLPREHSDDGYIGPDPEVDSYVNTESVDDVLNLGHVIGKLEAVVRPCGQHFTSKHADDGYIGPDPAIDSYINTRYVDHDGEINVGRVTNNKLDAQITPCTKSTVPPNGHCDDGYVGPDKEEMSHSLYVNTEQAEGQYNFADDIMDELETRFRL